MADDAAPDEVGHAGVLRTLKDLPGFVRFVLIGVFVNQFGAFLQAFMVLYLLERGFSARQAGFALAVHSVGAIAGVLFGGVVSDRLGPRLTIVLSMASAALLTLSVTMVDSFAAIAVAVTLAGAATQASRPAVMTLLLGQVPKARQVMVQAMYRTALSVGAVAGPLVAAGLSTISWDLVFWFDAATTIVYVVIAATVLPRADRAAAATERAARPSYLLVLRDRRYLGYLSLMLANGLVIVQFIAVLPLMLRDAGYATWAYGTLTALGAALVIGCELLVTRSTQRWPAWIAVCGGWVLVVIGRGMLGLPGGFTVLVIAVVIGVAGQIIGGSTAFAHPARVAPPGAMGRYIGSAHAVFNLGYVLGPIVGVLLYDRMGQAFWALCPALGAVTLAAGLWAMRAPAPPEEPPAGATPGPPDTDAPPDAPESDVAAAPRTPADGAPEPPGGPVPARTATP
ncbi:MAG TPA: MFS transporter [Pseudonocardiaceae bacterium]